MSLGRLEAAHTITELEFGNKVELRSRMWIGNDDDNNIPLDTCFVRELCVENNNI